MAYVDARIAQSRGNSEPRQLDVKQHLDSSINITGVSSQVPPSHDTTSTTEAVVKARQPAGAGKLQEIDLGPDSARQNVLRTQAAVFGGPSGGGTDSLGSKKGRRRRYRRTSEDIKRDQMVEKILSEAKRKLLALHRVFGSFSS
jgi:hypothetical protein